MSATIDRTRFLGGSDIAALLGLSPWATPWSLWASKVGLVTEHIADERLEIGKDAELFLASVFERHHPHLHLGGAQAELSNPAYPILRGHADGFVLESPDATPDDAVAGWEAKTAREFGWDDVPLHYKCQAQTYMLLTGLREWWFTVGFSGWTVAHFVVEADDEGQRYIADYAAEWWAKHVVTGDPPDVDGKQRTTEAIKQAYPTGAGQLEATDDLEATVREIDRAKTWLRIEGKRVDMLTNSIRVALGRAGADELTYGVDPKGQPVRLATWREHDQHDVDIDRVHRDHGDRYDTCKTVRTLRIHIPKPPKAKAS